MGVSSSHSYFVVCPQMRPYADLLLVLPKDSLLGMSILSGRLTRLASWEHTNSAENLGVKGKPSHEYLFGASISRPAAPESLSIYVNASLHTVAAQI